MSNPIPTLRKAGDIFFSLTFPERIAAKKLKETAAEHRCAAIAVMALAASILGLLKVVTIPVELCSGCVSLPMKAIIAGLKEKSLRATLPAILAWTFCILALALIVATVVAAAFLPPAVVFFAIGVVIAAASATSFLSMHNQIYQIDAPATSGS
ncbi:DUF5422 family protein [Chlamydiifrater phoenicopteri]|uniref:DUF5422 family protein n=1 Tax=Chlamydiifrater phoenicopteri TaxID=2681469 RepID=UPI001BCE586E|nr:DUF5422 family protein [Chlamydiifrater phoenicopteri]